MSAVLDNLTTTIVMVALLSATQKGNVARPEVDANEKVYTTPFERRLFLIIGICGLLFVPVFKTVTHLPPYLGMLLSLSVIWLVSEVLHKDKPDEIKKRLKVIYILQKVDTPTIFFFLGILLAVASLESAGQLTVMASWLNENLGHIFLIDMAIGVLSAVVDNVPLVAGAMGMYPIEDAASLAAMGMERIDFIWYMKHISLLALLGYLAGAGVYYLQTLLLHH